MRSRGWHHFLVKSSFGCQRTAMGGCTWICARGGERRSTWQVSWKQTCPRSVALCCCLNEKSRAGAERHQVVSSGGQMIKTHMDPESAVDYSSGLLYRIFWGVLYSIITVQTKDFQQRIKTFLISLVIGWYNKGIILLLRLTVHLVANPQRVSFKNV